MNSHLNILSSCGCIGGSPDSEDNDESKEISAMLAHAMPAPSDDEGDDEEELVANANDEIAAMIPSPSRKESEQAQKD